MRRLVIATVVLTSVALLACSRTAKTEASAAGDNAAAAADHAGAATVAAADDAGRATRLPESNRA